MEQTTLLCDEKHKHIDAKFTEHDDHFKKVDDELDILKGTATRTETVVQSLCEQIKSLVDTMNKQQALQRIQQERQQHLVLGIAGTTILLLVGFFVWYIQSLPR